MDLFGGRLPPVVQPAERTSELKRLADALGPRFRAGTSSWSFPGWRGIVWNGKHDDSTLSKQGLTAYASHPLLRAVGVDRAYYGPIDRKTWATWADQVPDDFRFVVKCWDRLSTLR